MKVLIVSGIWPPDVGGPASHAPEVAEMLLARGHEVEVVTTADRAPAPEAYPVHWASRSLPRGVRHARAVHLIAAAALRADVVYSTGMLGRSALGSALVHTPIVQKLTSDPTYERSIRYGLYGDDLDSFQRAGGRRVRALRSARNLALRRASRILVPSESLRGLATAWGIRSDRIEVLPNPVELPHGLGEREELRRRHGLEGPTLVFAGRLSVQKAVDVALEALTRLDGLDLVLAGDGPDAEKLRALAGELGLDGRARFLGPQPRSTVFELLRAGDAVVLPSKWENFPHVLVEALAVGTPVIATAAGGVTEIVRDGENGLLVPPEDPE
ncbi:MAG: glycosyltransferase family 4 protein, partial [Actinobacteria bacterium]|nr:glycosyltransferase family 4 protein [Actinomycetota bacterium]